MKLAIEQRLARREQVILFVNRRGFTPFLRCSDVGGSRDVHTAA